MSNRRQKSQKKFSLNSIFKALGIERTLSILSVLIAGIALLFAWQSNKISQESNELTLRQFSDQLIITKIIHLGSKTFYEDSQKQDENTPILYIVPDYIFCSHKIRLSNLGESSASLVNFSVRASYQSEIAFLEGFGEATTFSKNDNPFKSLPIKDIQSILISEEMLETQELDQSWLGNSNNGIDLPLSVAGDSSLDFIVHTIVAMNKSDKNFEQKSIGFLYPDQIASSEHIADLENYNENIHPFQMTYLFETADGQIIPTNPLMCWGIGVFPAGTKIYFETP